GVVRPEAERRRIGSAAWGFEPFHECDRALPHHAGRRQIDCAEIESPAILFVDIRQRMMDERHGERAHVADAERWPEAEVLRPVSGKINDAGAVDDDIERPAKLLLE